MRTRLWVGLAAVVLFVALVLFSSLRASAADNQPPGPDRYKVIVEDYTSYEWWLTDRTSNQVVCIVDVDHDGLPTAEDIFKSCGQDTYDQWILTKPCPQGDSCNGYYLQLIKSFPAERKVGVQQPPAVVWVTLNGCVPYRSTFRCDSLPTLVLTGEEPIQGEQIINLAGNIDGKPFTCDPICNIDLVPTDDNGSNLQFWAYSSYGDSSEVFQARVRVVKSPDPSDQAWYTDVLSSQWRGDTLAGCSQIWNIFPPVGGTPDWLTTPQRVDDLATDVKYEYLAAALIKNNVVDVSGCDSGGLLANGLANTCGLEAAHKATVEWQNRFDDLIMTAAQQTGVPAPMLKGIFSRESQFWPGTYTGHPEAGLGQMTDGGADAVLTWNPSFYEQFCPTVLDQSVCKAKIYPNPEISWQGIGLDDEERSILRGALVNSVSAVCQNCSMGIDMDKADYSVGVFAQLMLASCKQTGEVIKLNYTGHSANSVSYENMWLFTLVDYNAGPGCLGLAVDKTSRLGQPLDWPHLSANLTPACQGATSYVNDVSNQVPLSAPVPKVTQTSTPVPTIPITAVQTRYPPKTSTSTPTLTPSTTPTVTPTPVVLPTQG